MGHCSAAIALQALKAPGRAGPWSHRRIHSGHPSRAGL